VLVSVLTIALGMLLLVAQSAFGSLLPSELTPNVVLPIVIFLGATHDVGVPRGALTSFALGYVLDGFCGKPLGLHTFVMMAAYLAARGAGMRLLPQAFSLQVLMMFIAALGADATVLALRAIFERPGAAGLGDDVDAMLQRLLFSAASTAAIAPLIVMAVRRIEALRHRQKERALS
jgi:rod shape-determining protein MreD